MTNYTDAYNMAIAVNSDNTHTNKDVHTKQTKSVCLTNLACAMCILKE